MLIINSASAGGANYWAKDAVRSQWLGEGARALGLEGSVGVKDLRAVLAGRTPDGEPLTARPGARTRQGWDLVLAAPKSFSLLAEGAARAAPTEGQVMVDAMNQAVAGTVSLLGQRAAFVRTGGRQEAAQGIVAACFDHVTSATGQPHFHSHVVLANLGRLPGRGPDAAPGTSRAWGCLVGNELWRWREALGSGFNMALRHHLAAAGLDFAWDISPGGLGDIAAVPAEARARASTRSYQVRADMAAFGGDSAAARRVAQGTTRPRDEPIGPLVGWDDRRVADVLAEARAPRRARSGQPDGGPSAAVVSQALAARSSTFGEPDVLVALAETSPQGIALEDATHWARQWCPTDRGRSSTPQAQALDASVRDLVAQGRSAHAAEVSPLLADRELAELGAPAGIARPARQLVCGGEAVSVLPKAPWLVQAAWVDAARSAWQAGGVTVELAAPTELSARRWHALTSLRPTGPAGGRGRPGQRALVVDAADHLSPVALERLLTRARDARTKLVLVTGGTTTGTAPPLSQALQELAGPSGVAAGADQPVPIGELMAWPNTYVALGAPAGADLTGARLYGAFSGRQSLAHALSQWSRAAHGDVMSALLVAFGPAEADALNAGARHLAGVANQAHLGARWYGPDDLVMALNRSAGVPAGTRGQVVHAGQREISVAWQGRPGQPARLGPDQAGGLGYGYATTLPYLRSAPAHTALVVLGDPAHLMARGHHDVSAWLTLKGAGVPSFGPGGREARQRAGQAELAAVRAAHVDRAQTLAPLRARVPGAGVPVASSPRHERLEQGP